MIKIVEIKETLQDTTLLDNIYSIDKIVKEIIKQTEFITDLNKDDYNYINIILDKIKTNLNKANLLIKKNKNSKNAVGVRIKPLPNLRSLL